MMVTFVSECEKKALNRTRRVLDAFANRIGSRTWQTVITQEGLQAVKKLLRKTATKNTAVSCHWIRSRSRSELVWIVGNRSKFNQEGIVPVNYTEQEVKPLSSTEDWRYLPLIESLAVFAGLLHDFGKATVLFQNKLKGKNKTQSDPLRHEWVSVLFLLAIVGNKTDEEWLDDLISDEIHKKIAALKIEDIGNPLANLPPVATMLAWLIVSHHKLPMLGSQDRKDNKNYGKPVNYRGLSNIITSSWGYENTKEPIAFEEWFKYAELPSKSIDWQQQVKAYAIKLQNNRPQLDAVFTSELLRPIISHARLSLMLGDHYYSSQAKDPNWHSSVKLFANTDKQNQLKQQLDEHLVGVAKQAKENARKLPQFEATLNQDIRIINNASINAKSPKGFEWQDKAADCIEQWKQTQNELDKHHFGFFAVNMASTGKGKTFANAKIMQALSADEESLRYILALGLRTLTLQTGHEYRDKIKLKDDELAVLIGSKAILELDKQINTQNEELESYTGSESEAALLDNEIFFNGHFPEQGLDTVLKNTKDRQFLYAPVLACTIDHIIQATETKRGGRYILPTLRLMSSDLVIDEVDDFDNEDLIAIGRLIHLAGMLGRKVMISSATIPPDLAEGYFNAYQSGWRVFAKMRGKSTAIGCGWFDEFKPKTVTISSTEDYKKQHDKFVGKRVEKLNQQPAKRKANIAPCGTELSDYFGALKQAVLEKHQQHNFEDPKTQKKISIGVVRMANIDPCVSFTRFLLNDNSADDTEIKAMVYHSRQVLLMRHSQEQYLDKILKRHKGNGHILEDEVIRSHIDNAAANNIIFVLVATPVEEVGRDHDFDWAVIEPSSFRSFIQLAGRVLRHRDQQVAEPNIAIMKYNYRTLKYKDYKGKDKKKHLGFIYPGYQKNKDDLSKYNLEVIVNVEALAKKLDATSRVQKTNSSELANLEHKVIHELLTDYDQRGPEAMQGWIETDWWLTALPQQYVRFRGDKSQDMTLFLTVEKVFLEKGDRGKTTPRGGNNINYQSLTDAEMKNLWLKRDYAQLLARQAKSGDLEQTALIFGEINLPTYGQPLTNQQFYYCEQLGLTKTWPPVRRYELTS